MGKLNKLLFIAVCCVVIATPIIRYKLKAQNYLENLSSGVILEATQRVRGSVFESTKILLIDYLPEGSTGVVLNEPFEEGLFWGGPVAQSHHFWLVFQPQTGAISMVGNEPSIKAANNSAIIARFVGYAGWEKSQLEREILNGDWRVFKADHQRIYQWLSANNSINKKSASELTVE